MSRFASLLILSTLLPLIPTPASAQDAFFWAKYSLTGYGSFDMGYFCDNEALTVAVHGETKGSLSVTLGDVTSAMKSFDGSNGMGPDGYYSQVTVKKAAPCDQRANWPALTITAQDGENITIRWT